ncbi:MAG: STAS domain-containing protein [Paracoccaceae bacterium]
METNAHISRPPTAPGLAPRRFALPARMDMAATEEIAEALEHLRGTPVTIDGMAVEQVSTLCLQLLASACLQWRDDRVPFELGDLSPALREALQLLDLMKVFNATEVLECP